MTESTVKFTDSDFSECVREVMGDKNETEFDYAEAKGTFFEKKQKTFFEKG